MSDQPVGRQTSADGEPGRGEPCSEECADNGAQVEASVEHRQDGAAGETLDGGALDVESHLGRPHAEAEQGRPAQSTPAVSGRPVAPATTRRPATTRAAPVPMTVLPP